jgi:Ca2+-binding EF-hand superfamily protein
MKSILERLLLGVLGGAAVMAFAVLTTASMARAEDGPQPGAGPTPDQLKKQLLEKFDANGDGDLKGEELQKAQEAFLKAGAGAAGLNYDDFKKRFDRDNDGQLSPQEQGAALAAFQKARGGGGPATGGRTGGSGFGPPANGAGEGSKPRSRDAMIKRFDKNGDGKLSDDEKAEAQKELKDKKGGRPAGKLTDAMKKLDTDDDGVISDEEKAAAKKVLLEKRKAKGKKPE